MALPKSYLTSVKNLEGILNGITGGQAPTKFSQSYLEGLGFKSNADRLIIGVLKELGFLTPSGEPTERYFQFMDQTRSSVVLAEAIEDAYADLYQLHRKAHELSRAELKNKMKTISRGQLSDSVLDKMSMTFKGLAKFADFARFEQLRAGGQSVTDSVEPDVEEEDQAPRGGDAGRSAGSRIAMADLVYNIQIQLPESRDPAVYDALFRSLKHHLFE